MTREQQARLGEIAVWVGTANELLQQALAALYTADAWTATTPEQRDALQAAYDKSSTAARELTPLVKEVAA